MKKVTTKISGKHVEITDNYPTPNTTVVKIDGKVLTEAWIIQSFTYKVNVQTGKRELKLEYYEKPRGK